MNWLVVLYALASCALALYGVHAFLLALLYGRRRPRPLSAATPPLTTYPQVTVQLPIYNELHVVRRLLDAVAHLDWPRDRLQVQVLDDSDDETAALAAARAAHWRQRGVNMTVLRRPRRIGYKAGALAYGLTRAQGEFVAVFDADFVPPPDFLRRTIPHFAGRPRLGFVQARWGHLNAAESALTRAQALALDGHFVVEHGARQAMGWCINFNGSGGVWRRACIADAGGWQADTLAEDMDLSYRAQLRGWQGLSLPHVEAPAEVPPQLLAFKRQQARWATGATQCLRKLGPRLWRSPLPWAVRLMGLAHMAGYLVHPLSIVLLLATLPLLWLDVNVRWPLAWFGLASLGPPLVYLLGQRALYPDWRRRYAFFPVLALLGTGVALSNSIAVLRGLVRRDGTFRRTPKFHSQGQRGSWQGQRYALPLEGVVVGEAALCLYAIAAAALAAWRGYAWALPFLLLYVGGYGLVVGLSLWQARPALGAAQPSAPRHVMGQVEHRQ